MPVIGKKAFPAVVPIGILAKAALMLWLLIKGVDEERWTQKALSHSI